MLGLGELDEWMISIEAGECGERLIMGGFCHGFAPFARQQMPPHAIVHQRGERRRGGLRASQSASSVGVRW